MGRLSEYYDDPLEFRPERWLDAEGNELPVKPKAFAPFHAGPRTCLGKDMVGERYYSYSHSYSPILSSYLVRLR